MNDRCRGAMVGVAVGDALGASFEGYPALVPHDRLRLHVAGVAPLAFTDDTAMTIAVTESLLHVGALDEEHLAATFVARYEREPDRGYGSGTAALLRRVAGGADWRALAPAQFDGSGSYGNGAAMRAAPFGLWATDHRAAAALARRGARVTHTHPHAVDAAGLQAAAVAHSMATGAASTTDDLIATIRHVVDTPALADRLEAASRLRDAPAEVVAADIGTGVAALEAVPAAICAVLHHPDSFADAVVFAIGLGGDTDTIASMTAAISGARLGERAIPPAWVERTEGAALMRDLGDLVAARRQDH